MLTCLSICLTVCRSFFLYWEYIVILVPTGNSWCLQGLERALYPPKNKTDK